MLNKPHPDLHLLEMMRSTCPCFDVITITDKEVSLDVVLLNFTKRLGFHFSLKANEIANPVFEARDARYIYIAMKSNQTSTIPVLARNLHPLSKNPKLRQQTIAYLAPSIKSFIALWLVCPPETTGAKRPPRKINIFNKKNNDWLNQSHMLRHWHRSELFSKCYVHV